VTSSSTDPKFISDPPPNSPWYAVPVTPRAEDAVVVSSRVRLARNTAEFAFPHRLEKHDAIKLLARSDRYVRSLAEHDVKLSDSSESNQLLKKRFVSSDSGMGFNVNYLDHFRLWACKPGLNLSNCLGALKPLEDTLEQAFQLAVSMEWGYLSPLLNNLGTALSARLVLHLPALAQSLDNEALVTSIEGASDSRGTSFEPIQEGSGLFMLRNTETLGQDEQGILNKLASIARLLLHYELETLKILRERDTHFFDDSTWRSISILRNCRKIGVAESWKLLGDLKRGINSGVFKAEPLVTPSDTSIRMALFSAMPPWSYPSDTERADLFRQAFRIGD